MTAPRPAFSHVAVLIVGLLAGWGLHSGHSRQLLAGGNDRWGERALAAGPVTVEMDSEKNPVYQDALYYLNYSSGKLLTSIPMSKQVGLKTELITEFAERDLIADFQIKPGMTPHFLMTTASLGMRGNGVAPLYVFETESGQVGVYRVQPQMTSTSSKPLFELLDRRVDRRLGRVIEAAASR